MKKILIKTCLIASLGLAFISCENTEDRVFSESAADRATKQQKELRELLKSSQHGWKMVYYPMVSNFGGYTYLFNFKDDKAVDMLSDYDASGLVLEPGEWDVQLRGTASLVFTTRNKIHELSDPTNSPYGGGTGYYGEYQFGYYGHTENEIIMRSPKRNVEVVLTKATPEDWEKIKNHVEVEKGLTDPSLPYFKNLIVEGVGKYDLGYSASIRMLSSFSGEVDGRSNFALNVTDTGIALNPAIKTGNGEVSDLTFDPATNIFSGGAEGGKVEIIPSRYAANWPDTSYKVLLTTPQSTKNYRLLTDFPANSAIMRSSFISPLAVKMVQDLGVSANGAAYLQQIQIYFNASIAGINNTNYCDIIYNGARYIYVFDVTDQGDRMKIHGIGWTATPPANLLAFVTAMLGDDVYIRRESSKIQYSNPVFTLISTNANFSLPFWDYNINI